MKHNENLWDEFDDYKFPLDFKYLGPLVCGTFAQSQKAWESGNKEKEKEKSQKSVPRGKEMTVLFWIWKVQ